MKKRADILKQFGDRVRDLRKAQGLSQEDLAEKADLHYTYIGGVERGERNLSLKSIERIALALKMDIGELFSQRSSTKEGTEGNKIIGEINKIIETKNTVVLQLIRQLVKDIDDWVRERKK